MNQKPYDGKLYLTFSIVLLIIAILIGGISAYSVFYVEPKIKAFLDGETDEDWRQAYVLLREPQLFAGYDNFDRESLGLKNLLTYFDEIVYSGASAAPEYRHYLELLLNRRESGAQLGLKTAAFALILSLFSLGMFFLEKNTLMKNKA